jgi:hypothetical protein
VGLSGLLLCLAVHGVASAPAQTSTPPKKPAHASAAPASKAKHHTSGNATGKHTSTNTSPHTSARSSRTSAHTSAHTSAQKSNSHGKKGSKLAAKKRGQQAIDSDRAREIQEALIRERYIEGEPTGSWDDATQAAMQRYQADQGWQSKTTPDSRALIKLGLGPSHDHLLNPESAMTTTATTSAASAADDPKAGTKQTPAADNLPKQ